MLIEKICGRNNMQQTHIIDATDQLTKALQVVSLLIAQSKHDESTIRELNKTFCLIDDARGILNHPGSR